MTVFVVRASRPHIADGGAVPFRRSIVLNTN
jgi:hypothetical protein